MLGWARYPLSLSAPDCPRALLWPNLGLVACSPEWQWERSAGLELYYLANDLGKGFQDQEGRLSMCVFMYYDPDCF